MAKTFLDVSKNIINEAIEKILYVDDEIAIPFRTENKQTDIEFCSKLFQSFKDNNSIVDFYDFKRDSNKWEEKLDFFKGTDLLILDWNLDKEATFGFESTLKILDSAIQTDSLHFVNIYSSEKKSDLEDIPFYINAYYSGITPEMKKNCFSSLEDFVEEKGINTDEFFDKFKQFSLRLSKEPSIIVKGEIFKEISDWLKEFLGKNIHSFNLLLKNKLTENSLLKAYCKLSYVLNDCVLSKNKKETFSSDFTTKNFLFLNHTIIQVSQKKERPPEVFYSDFREAIIQSTNNFLTIMGLEMRNRFRKSSAFIGKDVDQISDLAFFFHKEHNNSSEESFRAFMKDIWKDQASSFLYSKEMDLEIFDSLEDYKTINELPKKIEQNSKNRSFDNDLARLNFYYNRLNVNRNLDGKIKFGDVFSINENSSAFLLCITAHCDCVHPEKIGNSLFFVKGTKGNINTELEEGDEGFSSYLIDTKGHPFVINWTDKPVSIFIPPNQNIVGSIGEVLLHGKNVSPLHYATLKDNYTQRIANRAFSYPMRVGIFFADRKDLKEEVMMIEIQDLKGKKITDIIKILEKNQNNTFTIAVPKSTVLYSSSTEDIIEDYAKLLFSGQLLKSISDSFEYEPVEPSQHSSVEYKITLSSNENLAKILLQISFGYVNSTEDDFYSDDEKFEFYEVLEQFIEDIDQGNTVPACQKLFSIYEGLKE